MNKSFVIPFILFISGLVITIIGALFKLMHWTGANVLLSGGMLFQAVALTVLIVVIFKMSKNK